MFSILAYASVIGVWTMVVVRLPFFRRTDDTTRWLAFGALGFGAVVYTCVQSVSYHYLVQIFSPAAIYDVCSLALAGLNIVLLRYTVLFDLGKEVGADTPLHIPGLKTIRRFLAAWCVLTVLVVLGINTLWMRTWITEHNITPVAFQVGHGALVVSRFVVMGNLGALFLIGANYPLVYVILHQYADNTPFYLRGGVMRLAVIIVGHVGVSLALFLHLATTAIVFFQPAKLQAIEAIAMLVIQVFGFVSVALFVLGCLPQQAFAGIQAYYFYRRLQPIHQLLNRLAPGILLDLPSPRLWDVFVQPVVVSVALNCLIAGITDARLYLYKHVANIPPDRMEADPKLTSPNGSSRTPAEELGQIAHLEAAILCALGTGRQLPCFPTRLRAATYQTLSYYRHLARALPSSRVKRLALARYAG